MNQVVRFLLIGLVVCLAVRFGAVLIGPVAPLLVVLLVLALVARRLFAGPRPRR